MRVIHDPDDMLGKLVKVAVRYDVKHGGHEAAVWSVMFLVWIYQMKEHHKGCGKLVVNRDAKPLSVSCPVHHFLVGPAAPWDKT